MITCPNDNCGAENEDGAKFCECCGTPLPQDKECPSCHNRVKLTAKFCAECGFNFNKQQVADKSGSMLSMGDKNVIAGDVIGKQENIKVSGNATIIKNEDESKKVATCHVCGQNLLVSEAVKCTDCGEITCSKCIDAKLNVCKNCASRIISNNEDIYKQALVRFLEDGKIEMSERDELKALQNKMGIEPQRAKELESIVRGIAPINSSATASNSFGAISPFDMEYYRKAERLFYEDFNYLETLELTEDLYQKYPSNENILTLHLNALAVADRKKAIEIINNLDVDVLGAVLVDIDIALAINTKNSIGNASEKLARAIPLWTDSTLLKCRQIIYLLKTASLLKDESFFSEADGIFDSIGEGKNKLERSWIFKAKLELSKYRGDDVPEITEEYCKEHDFYRSVIVDINEEKGRKFFEQAKTLLENWGTEKKGFSLLLKSAELNYLPAIRMVGIAYNDAQYSIEEKDQNKAIEFFCKGAEQDDAKCQMELGGCLIEKEDVAEGLKWVKKAVDQEFPEAECIYAMLYGRGEEIEDDNGNLVILLEKDLRQSFKYLKKAAEHGYGVAQHTLGMAYLTGKLLDTENYCEINGELALSWLKKSAEQVHDCQDDAMLELGKIYDSGEIVPKNEAEAKKWYEKAAAAGSSDAKKKPAPKKTEENISQAKISENELLALNKALSKTINDDEDDDLDFEKAFEEAMAADENKASESIVDNEKAERLYQKGQEFYKNKEYDKAFKYIEEAACLGYADAQELLGECYYDGKGITKNESEAVKWLHKAAIQNNVLAQMLLAYCYKSGSGVSENPVEATNWYLKAAKQGDITSQYHLANCYHEGYGVSKDYCEAAKWYRKAAEQGLADAQNMLGYCYRTGDGIPENNAEAVKWYRKAAAQGNLQGQQNLGFCYANGYGVSKDYYEAVKWYRKAAEQGLADAQYSLGGCYYNGTGVERNYNSAIKWFQKAAEQNQNKSQYILGICYFEGQGTEKDWNKAKKWFDLALAAGISEAKKYLDAIASQSKKEIAQEKPSVESNIDNIDFMAVLAKIIDNAIYVLPTDNVNKKKRWNEKQNSLKECGCFGISSNKLHSKQIIAYMEEKGLLFGISNSVVLTPNAIFTKKGVIVDITPETTAKFVADRSAKKFKDLIVDGIEVCSFFDVSPFGMEQWVNAIETIVRAQKASNEQLLLLAKHYLTNYSHCSFYPAYIIAFWAASRGCSEAITLIREIALQENDPYNFNSVCNLHNRHLEKFLPEIRFIYSLLRFNNYNIKNRFPNEDDKYHQEHKQKVLDVMHGFYASFKDGNAEAAYYIAQILGNGWGTISEIANVVKEKEQPDQTSFVYWYKKSAEGNFPAAIEQVKKFAEWEKEIIEKAPEELSFAARIYADKKQGILFSKDNTVLIKYPSSLKTSCYSIPNGVTHIAEKAFAECKSLVKVILPDSVVRIGNYSFSKCESLAEIILSDNLEFIGGEAFSYCEKLEKINLPESLRLITGCAFEWSGLKEITIPKGIKIIEDRTFALCEQLEKVTIGENVETIGYSAFFYCKKLKNIIWGKKLRYIKSEAFKGCSTLTHLALPSTVYAPEYHVFEDCKNLVSVMFPDGTGSEHEKALPTGCVPYVVPRNNEYENIVQLYEDAYSGAVESQYQFAAILMAGKGIKQNMREAVKWFSKVAEKGNVQAFLALGYAYSKGNGITKDLNKAFEFFKKAAEQKNAEAQYELGICFSTGQGVAQDSAEAINYFALAAEQGHEKAKQAEEAEKAKLAKLAEEARLAEEAAQNTATVQTETSVDLILESCGTNIDEVRKKICEIFQIEYSNAKEYTDIAPVYLCQEISLTDAEYVKQNLEAVGAALRIEPSKQNDITDNSTTEPDALISIAKVMITNFGSNKVEVIKLIRSYANLGLTGAKQIVDQNQKYFIDFDSWKKAYDAWNELQSAGATVALAGELLSDVSGTIIKFFAEPEKQFNKGDAIAIIESTEGEKSITIPYDCKIIKVGVKQEQQVSAGEGLVIFEYKQ